jgi:opacity protein-like surface antigen
MKKLFAIAAVAMCLSAPAFANDKDDASKAEWKADYYMKQIDTNSDGSISKEEHTAFGDKMFNDADTDKNGMISKEEMKAEKMKEMDKMKDAKGDMKK